MSFIDITSNRYLWPSVTFIATSSLKHIAQKVKLMLCKQDFGTCIPLTPIDWKKCQSEMDDYCGRLDKIQQKLVAKGGSNALYDDYVS